MGSKKKCKEKYSGKINLPVIGLQSLVRFYEEYTVNGKLPSEVDELPVQVVVIYNVEQLATEIAKHLKDSTNNNAERDNES